MKNEIYILVMWRRIIIIYKMVKDAPLKVHPKIK